mmetsp:Transcript_52319/g.111891  ORF Transcript_52319/g.111891 Transcript_52319/m.111891 type:complete len:121 (+) Transcript_52319:97-459(+)
MAASAVDRATAEKEQDLLRRKLQETGERERLKQHIASKLSENGWREELKKHCVEYIQNKGIERVTIEEITADIAPRGRQTLPDSLKTDLINRLRSFAEQQGLEPLEGGNPGGAGAGSAAS